MSVYFAMLLALAFACAAPKAAAADNVSMSTSVWGERQFFKVMHEQTGSANPADIRDIKNLERATFKMSDGASLNGYVLKSTGASESRACLLVALGNAQLCDKIAKRLIPLQALAIDIYLLDYRGYGQSPGDSSFAAFVTDYRQVVSQLGKRGYSQMFCYGLSIGGFVVLNAKANLTRIEGIIVDSTPAKIDFIRPEYQPVALLPKDCRDLLLISGDADRTVPPKRMNLLMEIARPCGANVMIIPNIGHPFDPRRPQSDSVVRIAAIKSFLEGRIK